MAKQVRAAVDHHAAGRGEDNELAVAAVVGLEVEMVGDLVQGDVALVFQFGAAQIERHVLGNLEIEVADLGQLVVDVGD